MKMHNIIIVVLFLFFAVGSIKNGYDQAVLTDRIERLERSCINDNNILST